MKQTLDIDLSPAEYCIHDLLYRAVARKAKLRADDIAHVEVLRRSLDSRRGIRYHTTVEVYCGEEYTAPDYKGRYRDCRSCPAVVIVGAGPAGLFAALRALEVGLRPVIIERGQPVEQRRLDIAQLARTQQVNPNSNWCFGEGGAGTYSDGKLYTRSTKRGNIQYVLERFIEHGANPAIAIDSHAHIGTDKLSGIIANIRHTIEDHGGEYHFSTRMSGLIVERQGAEERVVGVTDNEGNEYRGVAVILATGHSARDIYRLFEREGWLLEAKPFALGIRVEHPQKWINDSMYGDNCPYEMPAAPYKLTHKLKNGGGVYSFCMCPGGYVVNASSRPGLLAINGMSYHARNGENANSAIVVTVSPKDFGGEKPLDGLNFQEKLERRAFEIGKGKIPVQRFLDFRSNTSSVRLGNITPQMKGAYTPANVRCIFPERISRSIEEGMEAFGRQITGFSDDDVLLSGVESRTSSPVRILRGDTLECSFSGVYPCGEGAGYAGGITSAALDGIRVAEVIASKFSIDFLHK